jgi:hypothetical protein
MSAGFGKRHPTRNAGPFLAGLAWRKEKIKSIFTRKKSLITKESVAIAVAKSTYDNHKMLRALPSFHFRSLEDSIFESCLKYVKNPQPL